jgi:hypothetical protein
VRIRVLAPAKENPVAALPPEKLIPPVSTAVDVSWIWRVPPYDPDIVAELALKHMVPEDCIVVLASSRVPDPTARVVPVARPAREMPDATFAAGCTVCGGPRLQRAAGRSPLAANGLLQMLAVGRLDDVIVPADLSSAFADDASAPATTARTAKNLVMPQTLRQKARWTETQRHLHTPLM